MPDVLERIEERLAARAARIECVEHFEDRHRVLIPPCQGARNDADIWAERLLVPEMLAVVRAAARVVEVEHGDMTCREPTCLIQPLETAVRALRTRAEEEVPDHD